MNNAANAKPKLEAVTPRLPVTDVEKALAFYVDQLGFKLGWKWGNPVTHGNVCRDHISLDLISMPEGGAEQPWHRSSLAVSIRISPN